MKHSASTEEIRKRLLEIEKEEDVRIFYACESGSRAWGFPSADSDYDVRFLYLHPRAWYLSIDVEKRRDVIERPITADLDLVGWDLRKALNLLHKSNPPLLEWFNSPIVYLLTFSVAEKIRQIIPRYYSPAACAYHYLHMARGNYREYLKGDTVWLKKYFYVLRPLLAINWIEKESDVVPMKFDVLVERSVRSTELRREIENLLERKKEGQELDRGPRIEIISKFIQDELRRLETGLQPHKKPSTPTEELNELFRAALDEVF